MKVAAALLSLASMASAMCHHGTHLSPRSDDGLTKRADGVFGYHELLGPLNWNTLAEAAEICATGTNQSPINVVSGEQTVVRGSTFGATIPNGPKTFENLGTTVEVLTTGSARIGRKAYTLLQFHFHTPSEHHLNGEYFPAEVHFVFQAGDNSLMVIGFFIEISAANSQVVNPAIETALASVAAIPNAGDHTTTANLNFGPLLGHLSSSNVHRYAGSLTTPPCDQGVTFNVVEKPIYVSAARYRALKSVVKFNSRYTQNKPGQINLLQNAANVLSA